MSNPEKAGGKTNANDVPATGGEGGQNAPKEAEGEHKEAEGEHKEAEGEHKEVENVPTEGKSVPNKEVEEGGTEPTVGDVPKEGKDGPIQGDEGQKEGEDGQQNAEEAPKKEEDDAKESGAESNGSDEEDDEAAFKHTQQEDRMLRNASCAKRCDCSIAQTIGMLRGEITDITKTLNRLDTSGSEQVRCNVGLTPSEEKLFARSVKEDSFVCYVLIREIRAQRQDLQDMMNRWIDFMNRTEQYTLILADMESKLTTIEPSLKGVLKELVVIESMELADEELRKQELDEDMKRGQEREKEINEFMKGYLLAEDQDHLARLPKREADEEREVDRLKDRGALKLALQRMMNVMRAPDVDDLPPKPPKKPKLVNDKPPPLPPPKKELVDTTDYDKICRLRHDPTSLGRPLVSRIFDVPPEWLEHHEEDTVQPPIPPVVRAPTPVPRPAPPSSSAGTPYPQIPPPGTWGPAPGSQPPGTWGPAPGLQPPGTWGPAPGWQPPGTWRPAPGMQPPGNWGPAPAPQPPPPGIWGPAPGMQPLGNWGPAPVSQPPPPGTWGLAPGMQPPGNWGPAPASQPPLPGAWGTAPGSQAPVWGPTPGWQPPPPGTEDHVLSSQPPPPGTEVPLPSPEPPPPGTVTPIPPGAPPPPGEQPLTSPGMLPPASLAAGVSSGPPPPPPGWQPGALPPASRPPWIPKSAVPQPKPSNREKLPKKDLATATDDSDPKTPQFGGFIRGFGPYGTALEPGRWSKTPLGFPPQAPCGSCLPCPTSAIVRGFRGIPAGPWGPALTIGGSPGSRMPSNQAAANPFGLSVGVLPKKMTKPGKRLSRICPTDSPDKPDACPGKHK